MSFCDIGTFPAILQGVTTKPTTQTGEGKMNHETLNTARLHFSSFLDGIEWAVRHGGRLAAITHSDECYWYGCGVMPIQILSESPMLGIESFGTYRHFLDRA